MPKSVGAVSVSREQPAYEASCQHLLKAARTLTFLVCPLLFHVHFSFYALSANVIAELDSVKAIITAKVSTST